MHSFLRLSSIAMLMVMLLGACARSESVSWIDNFPIAKDELVSTGGNPHFILEPGHYLVLEDDKTRVIITVLGETKMVDGVETRVVEEREFKRGELYEVSRNYYAASKLTNDVFYFGEDVDFYKDGQIVNHEGAWLAGLQGAKFGMIMPGQLSLDAAYYQELAPDVSMDRARIVSTSETVATPAGEFTNCLKVEETTPLKPDSVEYKYYAPGVGMVRDGDLRLVEVGKATS
jgi:hypothetical protein